MTFCDFANFDKALSLSCVEEIFDEVKSDEILVEIRAIKGLRDRSVYITGSLASRIHLLQNTIIADTHKSRKYVDEMLVRTFLDLNDQQFPEEPKRKEYVNSIIYMTGSLL